MLGSVLLLLLLLGGGFGVTERPVDIPAGDGVTLSGTLTLPAGPAPFPAAVIVGGLGQIGRDGDALSESEGPYRAWRARSRRAGSPPSATTSGAWGAPRGAT